MFKCFSFLKRKPSRKPKKEIEENPKPDAERKIENVEEKVEVEENVEIEEKVGVEKKAKEEQHELSKRKDDKQVAEAEQPDETRKEEYNDAVKEITRKFKKLQIE